MMNPFLLCAFFCFALFIGARFLFFVAVIAGESMLPTFSAGDRVLVLRYWPVNWLRHNAVIVTWLTSELEEPQPTLVSEAVSEAPLSAVAERVVIKRIVGFPGETIRSTFPSERKWHIPPAHYFVRSDGVGVDSDMLGPVPFDCFQGLVLTKLSTRKVKNAG